MKTEYLIVEDDVALSEALKNELIKSSMTGEITATTKGESAENILNQHKHVDMVILDLTLEDDIYGMELLRRIRKFLTVPVVIFTADDAPAREIEAIREGANGYLQKKRYKSLIDAKNYIEAILEQKQTERYCFSGWTLDTVRCRLLKPDDAEVMLTGGEYYLLLVFVKNPRSVLKAETLIDKLNYSKAKNPHAALSKLLSRLRKKIGKDQHFILTVPGSGFLFTPNVTCEGRNE